MLEQQVEGCNGALEAVRRSCLGQDLRPEQPSQISPKAKQTGAAAPFKNQPAVYAKPKSSRLSKVQVAGGHRRKISYTN